MGKFVVALCTLLVSFVASDGAVTGIANIAASSAADLISLYSGQIPSASKLGITYESIRDTFLLFGWFSKHQIGEIVRKHDEAIAEYSDDKQSCADSTLGYQTEQLQSAVKSCSDNLTADLATKHQAFTASLEQFETYLNDQAKLLSQCRVGDDVTSCSKEIFNEVSSTAPATWVELLNLLERTFHATFDYDQIPSICGLDFAAFQEQADASLTAVQQCATDETA